MNPREDFLNHYTGEFEKRKQMGTFGNIYLSDTEISLLYKTYSEAQNYMDGKRLIDLINDADEYIQYHWDYQPVSFPYMTGWIKRRAAYNRKSIYQEITP